MSSSEILEAEAALKHAEQIYGATDTRTRDCLLTLARLLRQGKTRLLDAVNLEARAALITDQRSAVYVPNVLPPIVNNSSTTAIQSHKIQLSRLLSISTGGVSYALLADTISQMRICAQEAQQLQDVSRFEGWNRLLVYGSYAQQRLTLGTMRSYLEIAGFLMPSKNQCPICRKSGQASEECCTKCYACFVCSTCGSIVSPVKISKFKLWLAVILCFFCFIPAMLYMLWAHFTEYEGCPKCQGKTLIPANSSLARNLLPVPGKIQFDHVDDDSTTCPFCAEVVKRKAVLCKHCRSDLSGKS